MKVKTIPEYRRWVKIELSRRDMNQSDLAILIGAPRQRVSESLRGKPSGKRWTKRIIQELGGNEDDFKDLLTAV